MNKESFAPARFISTALWPEHYPQLYGPQGQALAEIACLGRSNVGKSSLLNNLFGSQKLVKTSATPGKTQALNFFIANNSWIFVDLPGYGYAKVPKKVQEQWAPMMRSYFEKRSQLQVILFLFDIRRQPQADDCAIMSWAISSGKPIIMVLTKVDKVNQSTALHQAKTITSALQAEHLPVVCYSVPKNRGRRELTAALSAILSPTGPERGAS